MSGRAPGRVARWRYVVPNAITCASLLLGLAAVFVAMDGDPLEGAWLIVLCVLLDKADGTAARLLKATSHIGRQLDSFADFVTFGIAPAFILFAHIARDPAGVGDMWAGEVALWILRVLLAAYVLCACIRLAKFNVLDEILPKDGPKVFYGLPSTFAGGMAVVLYIIGVQHGWDGLVRWMPVVAVAFGALMVSSFPLPKLGKRKAMWLNVFSAANVAMGFVCGIFRIWPEYIAISVTVYAVFGFGWGAINRHKLMPKHLDPYPQ